MVQFTAWTKICLAKNGYLRYSTEIYDHRHCIYILYFSKFILRFLLYSVRLVFYKSQPVNFDICFSMYKIKMDLVFFRYWCSPSQDIANHTDGSVFLKCIYHNHGLKQWSNSIKRSKSESLKEAQQTSVTDVLEGILENSKGANNLFVWSEKRWIIAKILLLT